MTSNWSSERVGISQRNMGSKIDAVCSDENVSVDMVKITPAHTSAGHQALSQLGISNPPIRGCISGSCGAGRGLRQDCSGTKDYSWDGALRQDSSERFAGLKPSGYIQCSVLRYSIR